MPPSTSPFITSCHRMSSKEMTAARRGRGGGRLEEERSEKATAGGAGSRMVRTVRSRPLSTQRAPMKAGWYGGMS